MTVNSPWTYLGSARFAEIARRHGCSVDIKPAKFGDVFAKYRRPAAAQAQPRAPRLSPDGHEAMARSSENARQSRAQVLSVQRGAGHAPGAGRQARRQGCARARHRDRQGAVGERAGHRHGRGARRMRQARRPRCGGDPQGRAIRCRARRAARHVTPPRRSRAACSVRRATCWSRARSSGARTGWSFSTGPWHDSAGSRDLAFLGVLGPAGVISATLVPRVLELLGTFWNHGSPRAFARRWGAWDIYSSKS